MNASYLPDLEFHNSVNNKLENEMKKIKKILKFTIERFRLMV